MFFETEIPVPLVLAVLVLALAAAGWGFFQQRSQLPARHRRILLGLRLVGILLLGLLAMNPFLVDRRPDYREVYLALLPDASESMDTRDLPQQRSRFEWTQQAVSPLAEENLRGRLQADLPVVLRPFAERLLPDGAPYELTGGRTAIGDTLARLIQDQAQQDRLLGGVVLFSDGISLSGQDPVEVAKQFREAGIPISTIGVGSETAPGDLAVEFVDAPEKMEAAQPNSLDVSVANHFGEEQSVTVALFAGERQVASREVAVAPGGKTSTSFAVSPTLPGTIVYRARLLGVPEEDVNTTTDIDYAAVEVTGPQEKKVLYLGGRLTPQFRFVQQALRGQSQLQLSAIIRVGPEKFYNHNLPNEAEGETTGPEADPSEPSEARLDVLEAARGFPEDGNIFFDYHVLMIDTLAAAEFTPGAQEAVRRFLADRAGGVLFFGPVEALPESLEKLVPVRNVAFDYVSQNVPLELSRQPVFNEAAGGSLFQPPALYLPGNSQVFLAENLAPAARISAETRGSELPILAVQAFGAGRVGYLGLEDTWRWSLAGAHSAGQHRLFWQYLTAWLSSGGRPRIELPLQGIVADVGRPLDLDALVRGRDFQPAVQAEVRATVSGPRQDEPATLLAPSMAEPGRFQGSFSPSIPGEYRVDYLIEIPGEDPVRETAYFAAARAGLENEDVEFREQVLRDIARVTGGEYVPFAEAANLARVPVSENLPMIEQKLFWTRSAWFLLIILAIFASEWWLRRRIGLK